MSISTIRPSTTVTASRLDGRPSLRREQPRHAVDQHPLDVGRRELREHERPARHLGGAAHEHRRRGPRRRAARRPGRAARPARRSHRRGGGEEGVDDLALLRRDPASGAGCPLHAATGAAGELPRGVGRAVRRSRAISSNGTANMSCSTNASRSAGVERLQHHQQREPDRVGEHRLLLRVGRLAARRRPGRARARSSGPRAATARERSMSRHTRATTVVSQPPRFSTSSRPSARAGSHASCTASSASANEPSIR